VRLKTLEIKGFKSFADKTVINLDNQVTGIIGPNGCGKSNIVDAIRWVIGEHKIRALRSQNLDDLIFNGSKSRNSSGLAEVSLTFENTKNLLPTEFNTVTISRKFFKNGESQYRLNDVNCRLKDITNLFMDTGVSSDSYAIIELGMVDDIIKDKENSRRRMLEQAAGISIYKTRRKEANLKLSATQQDLDRIEDLLFEISNNLRTLESQSKKAEKYFEIKSLYKDASIEYVKANLEDFNSTYQNLNNQQKTELDKTLSLEAEIGKEGAILEQHKLALIEKENQLQLLQRNFNQLIQNINGKENEKNLLSQKLEHLNELLKSTKESMLDAEKQNELISKSNIENVSKIEFEKNKLEQLIKDLEVTKKLLDEKRTQFDSQKNEVDKIQSNYQTLQIKGFDAEKIMAIAENNIINQERSIQQLEDDNTKKEQQITLLQSQLSEVENKSNEKENILAEMLKKQEEASAKILLSQEELENLRADQVEVNRNLDSKQNEFDLLKSLVDSLEGYPDSIKFLSKNNNWNAQAILLSEIFTVEDKYKLCIENYLERYLNYFVVENADEAYKAVDLLKAQKKGRAGFFILSELNENKKAEIKNTTLIAAKDLVKCNSKYENLINLLLENVFIASSENDTIDDANAVILNIEDGAFASKKIIVGGSVGIFEGNKIGRKSRLDSLKNIIDELQEKSTLLKSQIAATYEKISGYNKDLQEKEIALLKTELNGLHLALAKTTHQLEENQKQIAQANERTALLKNQLAETKNSISSTQDIFKETKQQLSFAFNELQSTKEKFAVAEADYNTANENYNQQHIVLTRQQSKINELSNELEIRKKQLDDLILKIEENTVKEKNTNQQLLETNESFKTTEELLFNLLKNKESDEKILSESDQEYYNFRNKIAELESILNKKRKTKEESETLLTSIKDKLTEMKIELTSMKERLHVEFKVNLEEVLTEARIGNQPLEELNEEVEKLKKRIQNLGEVNPMAVEAFKEMKSRFDFISEQKQDLVTAKENLMRTIEEVELTANQKLMDTFEQVRTNFIQVFQALFTKDDKCDMRLTDPNDIAETGIEIYAQPKGKNPKTITQLSGGEKTLTSTAFLFAIYLIKPAPFCILDEVDAPLDDANVEKFTNMIRKFSDNSQFIIVTHNKQTMSTVDVIYGVTMQEAGVSKLVPVDFRSLRN
jgi:chromosome segregation protein